MDERAASRCSDRIMSTVLLNAEAAEPRSGVIAREEAVVESNRETLCDRGLSWGDCICASRENSVLGVMCPGESEGVLERCNASSAARRRRFVVPIAFVELERAEHTIATLC